MLKANFRELSRPIGQLPGNFGQFFPPKNDLSQFFDAPAYLELISDVIASKAFQRLRDIRFLGAIDYLVHPNGAPTNRRHTRFDHSIGVARLARQYSVGTGLSTRDEKHLVIAALLHDVGHGPLSHSLEPVFKEKFLLAHHTATNLIVRGTVSIGASLPSIFIKHGIDQDEIVALIDESSSTPYVEALRSPINIDTIEGILRAYTYIAPRNSSPSPDHVLKAMIERRVGDETTLDRFWAVKNCVYNQLINSPAGVVADHLCRDYMNKNEQKFWSGNYFMTETAFRRAHPQLFSTLTKLRESQAKVIGDLQEVIHYQKREFFVDQSIPLVNEQSFYARYLQRKIDAKIDTRIYNAPL